MNWQGFKNRARDFFCCHSRQQQANEEVGEGSYRPENPDKGVMERRESVSLEREAYTMNFMGVLYRSERNASLEEKKRKASQGEGQPSADQGSEHVSNFSI